jgi:hypothetical protein
VQWCQCFLCFFFVPLFDDDDELDKGLSVALRLFKRPAGCLSAASQLFNGKDDDDEGSNKIFSDRQSPKCKTPVID